MFIYKTVKSVSMWHQFVPYAGGIRGVVQAPPLLAHSIEKVHLFESDFIGTNAKYSIKCDVGHHILMCVFLICVFARPNSLT